MPPAPFRIVLGVALGVVLTLGMLTPLAAQSGPIAPARRTDWSGAGAGTIPARATQCGPTIAAYSGSGAAITTAIQNCGSGQFVRLGPGTFNLSSGFWFNGKANVTLRGSGASSTILKISGFGGGDCAQSGVCVSPTIINYPDGPQNVANWTAGYAPGTTAITLSSTANLGVNSILILDQLDDPNTDNGEVWVCDNVPVCASSGTSGVGRADRHQMFVTRVCGINANVVTLCDPLIQPNWRAARSPGAWWAGNEAVAPVLMGAGLEDMTFDWSGMPPTSSIAGLTFYNCNTCWLKNVRSIALEPSALRGNVRLVQSAHITIRDSYFYNHQGATANYGIELYTTSNVLVENNITDCSTGSIVTDASVGNVYAYNYSLNNCYINPSWMQPSNSFHSVGNQFVLLEGNVGAGLQLDEIHGTAQFITAFRNRYWGWEPGKVYQTVPIHNYAFSRYQNIVGNVLGTEGYHNNYTSSAPAGTQDACHRSIYSLGWGGNCVNGGIIPNDPLVAATLLRWGNYDTVNGAMRFLASEVPTNAPVYPNPVPADTSLPASLYRTAAPSWWITPWGVPTWPAIGPGVTGGNQPGSGGFASKIPAQLCYENSSVDAAYAVSHPVTGASWSAGTVTLTIGTNNLKVGNALMVSGVNPAAYNGSFLITARTATTVSYGRLASPGAYVSGGVVKSPGILTFDANTCYQAGSAPPPTEPPPTLGNDVSRR